MPPIIEERYPIGGPVLEPRLLKGDMDDAMPELASVTKKAVLPPTVNEERALVLYKPVHSHFGSSLKMDPELISGLKSKYIPDLKAFSYHVILCDKDCEYSLTRFKY